MRIRACAFVRARVRVLASGHGHFPLNLQRTRIVGVCFPPAIPRSTTRGMLLIFAQNTHGRTYGLYVRTDNAVLFACRVFCGCIGMRMCVGGGGALICTARVQCTHFRCQETVTRPATAQAAAAAPPRSYVGQTAAPQPLHCMQGCERNALEEAIGLNHSPSPPPSRR